MNHQEIDVERFVQAQEGVYSVALQELQDGRKRSHWMWFVFPQVAGLGSSAMAERYAIRSRREAEAYRDHPVLGPRLQACVHALLQHEHCSARDVMGAPDDVKLRSSMTLFAAITPANSPYAAVLERYFNGETDERTRAFLNANP